MNRRNFLKSLLAIPLLKPEILSSVEDTTEIRELNMVGNGTVYVGGSYFPYPDKLAVWNGESWTVVKSDERHFEGLGEVINHENY